MGGWRLPNGLPSFYSMGPIGVPSYHRSAELTMSDLQYIRVEWDGELAMVVIDRAEKLNALNAEVVRELGDVFRDLKDDDDVLGVILSGAGEKAFVAGADIGELAQLTPLTGMTVSREGQRIFNEIERFPKPVLAAVGGYALGGGCELALACHLRVAGENARFGLPEVGLGIIPGYGGTMRLARVVGFGLAVEMILTGAMVDADRAERIGLVSAVYPQAELLDQAKTFMRGITKNGPVAVRMALESIYLAQNSAPADAASFESALFGLLASTSDMKEGMTAFLEKRKAAFKGE
jgi:enoyl-CoA hydratase